MIGKKIAVLGCGNIGTAIVKGLIKAKVKAANINITRRKKDSLNDLKKTGCIVTNNQKAVIESNIIILAVGPSQILELLNEISPHIEKKHLIISIVAGISISKIQTRVNHQIPIIRAMPNTAASLGESMTCLASKNKFNKELQVAKNLFDKIGTTLIIDETKMSSATALCACGIAFFLRAIRASSQGGIEIGFHSDEAFIIASQTARGAATLLLDDSTHPEQEIDKVTTPMGATISGLNEMEHQGFSSAMIKGITVSTNKITKLFEEN